MTDILSQYATFVNGVTSEASKNDDAWLERIKTLKSEFAAVGMEGQIARLTTAVFGLNGESAECSEHVKKILFHGKPLTVEIRNKLVSECGDVAWYWMQLCIALGVDPVDVLLRNISKLESRYEGGRFSIEQSENRKPGDI